MANGPNAPAVNPAAAPAEQYAPDSGNASVVWTQSPRLTPNVGIPEVLQGGQLKLDSANDFLVNHARALATVACAVGGSFSSGDVVTLTFTNPTFPNGAVNVAYTLVAGDTTAAILADHLAGAINGSGFCAAYGITGATNGAGNLTISQPGPVANYTVVSAATTGSETFTFTPSSGDLSGGSGPVLPWKDFTITYAGQQFNFRTSRPQLVDVGLLAVLVNEGHPVA